MIEEKVREAIIEELKRQAEADPQKLRVEEKSDEIAAHGSIDVESLVMAVVGSVAGGP